LRRYCPVKNDLKEDVHVANLRPRARIVRTIGDQLISGPEAALIELVKNAFDADSPFVRITITPPGSLQEGRQAGEIIVTDNGHGMTAAELVDKWFEPATDVLSESRMREICMSGSMSGM
jgi:hypothetical protein